MSYVPIHDRVSNLPRSPRYASPDLDLDTPLRMSEPDYDESYDSGPSKKRRRDEDNGERPSASSASSRQPPPVAHVNLDSAIQPSIFGIAPRNEITKTIGEFIMGSCRGVENVEIEIKLGTLHSVASDGQPSRRIRMPTMTEMSMCLTVLSADPSYAARLPNRPLLLDHDQSAARLVEQTSEQRCGRIHADAESATILSRATRRHVLQQSRRQDACVSGSCRQRCGKWSRPQEAHCRSQCLLSP